MVIVAAAEQQIGAKEQQGEATISCAASFVTVAMRTVHKKQMAALRAVGW
jgi:hypothetical protein